MRTMPLSFAQTSVPSVAPSTDTAIQSVPRALPSALLWRVEGVLRTLRPHQWVKNLFVLAPVVFAKTLSSKPLIVAALSALAMFCLLAGAVYTMNDLADAQMDRAHPLKRGRPIASGQLPERAARIMVVVLLSIAIVGAAVVSLEFLACIAAYFLLNVAYSFVLKRIAYIDVACISSGFVLRVLAGGFATGIHVSGFMIACTALLALFLGFGKRRHEMAAVGRGGKQRQSLEAYSPRVLDLAIAVTGVASVATYLAYALDPVTQRFFGSSLLWLTSIHPLVGVWRFCALTTLRAPSESPTEEMLRDIPFVLNLVAWTLEVVVLLYGSMPR